MGEEKTYKDEDDALDPDARMSREQFTSILSRALIAMGEAEDTFLVEGPDWDDDYKSVKGLTTRQFTDLCNAGLTMYRKIDKSIRLEDEGHGWVRVKKKTQLIILKEEFGKFHAKGKIGWKVGEGKKKRMWLAVGMMVVSYSTMTGRHALEGKDQLAHFVLGSIGTFSFIVLVYLIYDWYQLHKHRSKRALKDWKGFLKNEVKFECRHRLRLHWGNPPEWEKYKG